MSIFFFLNDTATTEIYTLSLHDALPISTRYLIDPADHFAAMRTARSNGRRVIGAYHSHPASAPTPSDSDIAEATGGRDFLYVIVSPATEQVAGYYLRNGKVNPVEFST